MRRALGALVAALAVASMAAGEVAAEEQPSTASSAMNHAAVVIDTGDGNVRKLCLAFPEAEISGIEALRRVDTRPHRFETFNGKGSGVCMLCGVGCESGDCFCNRTHYWAYHRAGPGESQYRTSSLGASNTVVRDGDVEAWKWGTGGAPMKTSVSEVCSVAEPPARTSATATTSAGPATTEPPPTTTTAGPTPTSTSAPATVAAPTSTSAPRPAASGTPTTTPTLPGTPAAASEVAEPLGTGADAGDAALPGPDVRPVAGAEDESASTAARASTGTSGGELAGFAAFTALLGGLLVWRSRLRRAKVRRMTALR